MKVHFIISKEIYFLSYLSTIPKKISPIIICFHFFNNKKIIIKYIKNTVSYIFNSHFVVSILYRKVYFLNTGGTCPKVFTNSQTGLWLLLLPLLLFYEVNEESSGGRGEGIGGKGGLSVKGGTYRYIEPYWWCKRGLFLL